MLIGLIIAVCVAMRRNPQAEYSRFVLPEQITPFTVIGLLKQIQENSGLGESGKEELDNSINRLQRYYFVDGDDNEPDLRKVAEGWIQKASSQTPEDSM